MIALEAVADDVRYLLRIPRGLHAALVELAHAEMRSLQSQIIYLLRQDVIELGKDPDAEQPE